MIMVIMTVNIITVVVVMWIALAVIVRAILL
jgi:hypothetical protein